jgi:hypothetical protein
VDNLEEQLDHLYTLEPAMFVAARDQLARELRAAGRRDEAEQVKHLRKPSISAWTINQLTRQERRNVDLLLDAGHRLREAQQGLLAGDDRKSLDEARGTQHEALTRLRQAARRILGKAGHGSEATLDRMMVTLQAAGVSNEGRELLARGRLTIDLEATGFELLGPLAEGVPKQESARQRRPVRKRDSTAAHERRRQELRKRLEDARVRLHEARASAKAAEKELRAAERNASKAGRDLAQAEERVHKTRVAAEGSQEAVEQAERELRDIERKAS